MLYIFHDGYDKYEKTLDIPKYCLYTNYDKLKIYKDLTKLTPVERNVEHIQKQYQKLPDEKIIYEISKASELINKEKGMTEEDFYEFECFDNIIAKDEQGNYYEYFYKTLYDSTLKQDIIYCILYRRVKKKN